MNPLHRLLLTVQLVTLPFLAACPRNKSSEALGAYQSACELSKKGFYGRTMHVFNQGNQYGFETQYFADKGCIVLTRTQKGSGKYDLSQGTDIRNLDLVIERITNYAHLESEAEKFEEYGWNCQSDPVKAGMPVECNFQAKVYTIFKASGDMAFLGALTDESNGTSPERRPSSLQNTALYRLDGT